MKNEFFAVFKPFFQDIKNDDNARKKPKYIVILKISLFVAFMMRDSKLIKKTPKITKNIPFERVFKVIL
ncbi:hypothetical protein [Campylobacter sputorum]|uniref:hypothetical protein n=1 Tax=Campylobacter sputorum TaxID=206 RepID=UPI000B78AAC9|nr:hypothetical protein [Campylobacter sputorum]KAB0581889.1 hypothetical protein F7P64_04175 [Campylobacter sputorum subsp. sputorum]